MIRKHLIGIVSVLFLIFSPLIVFSAESPPLPPDLVIHPPDPKISGASFSGIWEGMLITSTGPKTPQTRADLCIAVERIHEDGSVDAVYAFRQTGKESVERVKGKLSPKGDEMDLVLPSGAKVNLYYNPSQNKVFLKYERGRVVGDAVLSLRGR